jgi:hypothetical protein
MLGVLAQVPLIGTAYAQQAKKQGKAASPAEYEPFVKIAKAKNVKIFVNQDAPVSAMGEAGQLHLDMNMVRASLENAITRSEAKGQKRIAEKLRRLLDKGTPVQQVDFVHGGGTYYFPEDVEKAIADSGKPAAAGVQCWVCNPVCYLVCTCQQKGDQYCKERCKQVCEKYC